MSSEAGFNRIRNPLTSLWLCLLHYLNSSETTGIHLSIFVQINIFCWQEQWCDGRHNRFKKLMSELIRYEGVWGVFKVRFRVTQWGIKSLQLAEEKLGEWPNPTGFYLGIINTGRLQRPQSETQNSHANSHACTLTQTHALSLTRIHTHLFPSSCLLRSPGWQGPEGD